MMKQRSAIERTIEVQRKFELLLLGQANANSAVASMLMELSEGHPEIREDVDRLQIAMRQMTEAQINLLGDMCGLTERLAMISRASAVNH